MKPTTKFNWFLALIFIAINTQSLFAQTKSDVFDEKVPVTFLGVDYSQTKFIGSPTKGIVANSKSGTASNDEFRDVFTTQWNQLFIDEMKKYDIAKAIHRPSVKYAIDVAIKNNKNLTKKDFFSNNPSDFKTLTEQNISELVKSYDFQNNDGIGLIFFVEGMSKGEDSMGVWVTFVDIKSKKVLFTTYQTSKPGGFGFRNYWAKPLAVIVKKMEEGDFKKWSRM